MSALVGWAGEGEMVKGRVGRPAVWAAYPRPLATPPPGSSPGVFDQTTGSTNRTVELYLTGLGWVDITTSTRGNPKITWTTGRPEGQSRDVPGSLRLSLNNRAGVFSPRNPTSPYFGKLGRNTPIRLRLASVVVWAGELAELPQRWDVSGNDRWVPVVATGPRRRLTQGAKPLRSPLYRALTRTAGVAEYWPLDEPSGATRATSGLTGHAPLVGTANYGKVGGFPSNTAAYLETLAGSTYANPPYTTQLSSSPYGAWTVDHWFRCTVTDPATVGIDVPTMRWITTGTQYGWFTTINRSVIDGSSGVILGSEYYGSESGSGYMINEVVPDGVDPFDGEWHMLRASAVQNSPTSFTMSLWIDGQLAGSNVNTNPPSGVAGNEVGRIIRMQAGAWAPNVGVATNVSSLGVGELAVWDSDTAALSAAEVYAIGTGYVGETAGRRCERLCAEQGIPFAAYGDLDDTFAVGPQTTDEVMDLLDLAAASDHARIVEQRDAPGLAYMTRSGRYNPSGPVISHADHVISPPFAPTDDDTGVVNDQTVTNVSGTRGRFVKEFGPLNAGDPGSGDPDAVGRYDGSLRVSLHDEDLLDQLAGWLVHEGTWDEARWPAVTFEPHRSAIRNDPVLLASLLALAPGSTFTVTNPPAGLPPEDIELRVEGITGSIDNKTITLTFRCSPAGVLRVGMWDDPTARYESSGTWLTTAVDSSATTLTVYSTGPRWVVPTDSGYTVPFDLMVGGERMTVTAIAQSATDAFARVVANGWGTADVGGAWTNGAGPPAADFSVSGSVGAHTMTTLNTDYLSILTLAGNDHDVRIDARLTALPASGAASIGVLLRYAGPTSYLVGDVQISSTGAVLLNLRDNLLTSFASTSLPTPYVAGDWWRIHGRVEGGTVSLLAYPTTGAAPAGWHLTGTTGLVPVGAGVGAVGRNDSAATRTGEYDLLVVANPQTMTVTRSVNGVVKSHEAGTAVKLFRPARYAL